MGDAAEVIAEALLVDGLHAHNVAGGLLSDAEYAKVIGESALAALRDAGYVLVPPDAETREAMVHAGSAAYAMKAMDDDPDELGVAWGPAFDAGLAAALASLAPVSPDTTREAGR